MRRILFTLGLLFASPAFGAIAADSTWAVQDRGNAGNTTVQVGLSAISTGDLIVCGFTYSNTGSHTISTFRDANANSFTIIFNHNNTTTGQFVGMAYRMNTSNQSNEKTITMTLSATTSFMAMGCRSYTGANTSSALDVTPSQDATGTNPTSTAATTACNGELIVGNLTTQTLNNPTAGSGFTIGAQNTASFQFTEDQIQSSAGSIATTWTLASDNYTAQMAAFKPVGCTGAGGMAVVY